MLVLKHTGRGISCLVTLPGLVEATLSWSGSSRLEGYKSMDAETWLTLAQFYECIVCISLVPRPTRESWSGNKRNSCK